MRQLFADRVLVLDWNAFIDEDPYKKRSITKQKKFIKEMKERTNQFIRETIYPEVLESIGKICEVRLEGEKSEIISIDYPKAFDSENLFPRIKLEIDARGSWMPNESSIITSYAAEEFPPIFEEPSCRVNVVKAERTFWEKAAILHKAAYRSEANDNDRELSRHYYDLAKLNKSGVKARAIDAANLLFDVIRFTQMFYPCSWARYDLAKPPTYRLIPENHMKRFLYGDYEKMKEMFFGEIPSFDEILENLTELESEINALDITGG